MYQSKRLVTQMFGALVVGILLGIPLPALPRENHAPTDAEIALLPQFCKDKYKNYDKTHKKWETVLGREFIHIHHYCNALYFIARARRDRGDAQARKYHAQVAMGNIEYMFNNTPENYVLAPDFYITKADILSLQGERASAEVSYRKATEIRPDYPKAWLALSDFFVQTKRPDLARDALEAGLKAAPEKYKDYMLKRLGELDAKTSSSNPHGISPAETHSKAP